MTTSKFLTLSLAMLISASAFSPPIGSQPGTTKAISEAEAAAAAHLDWVAAMLREAPHVGACEKRRRVTRFQASELITRWTEAARKMNIASGGEGDTTKLAETVDSLRRSGRRGTAGIAKHCSRFVLKIQGA